MLTRSICLTVGLWFVLPLALASTNHDDPPGPHSIVGQSSLALGEPTTDDVPVALDAHHSDRYAWSNIQGFWTQIRLPQEMDLEMSEDYTELLDLLNRQLKRAKGVLPETAFAKLQTKVYIFVKDDCTEGGDVYYWRGSGAEVGWIILHCFEFLQNILDDAYSGGESVHGNRVWGAPGTLVHELAHGWHDLFVDDGFDNRMIEEFYDHAVDCLGNTQPDGDPYYWESNEREFFADFTIMYYLSHWDPPGRVWNMQQKYRRLVIRLWNEDEYPDWDDELDSCGT